MEVKNGYYISHPGDTVYGKFKIRIDFKGELHFTRLQNKAYFIDSYNNTKVFKPEDLLSYTFEHEGEFLKFVSIYFYKKRKLFLKVENEDGYLNLYSHYRDVVESYTDYGNLNYYLLSYPNICKEDYHIIIKPDGKKIKVGVMYMSKKLSIFLAEYPELAYKIRNKTYDFEDVDRIVWRYNIWYKKEYSGNAIL